MVYYPEEICGSILLINYVKIWLCDIFGEWVIVQVPPDQKGRFDFWALVGCYSGQKRNLTNPAPTPQSIKMDHYFPLKWWNLVS